VCCEIYPDILTFKKMCAVQYILIFSHYRNSVPWNISGYSHIIEIVCRAIYPDILILFKLCAVQYLLIVSHYKTVCCAIYPDILTLLKLCAVQYIMISSHYTNCVPCNISWYSHILKNVWLANYPDILTL
jgi:hypothetical protein